MWVETRCLNNLEPRTNRVHRCWSSSAPRWSLHSLQSQLLLIRVVVPPGRCGEIARPAAARSHSQYITQSNLVRANAVVPHSIIKAADHTCVSVLRHPLKRNNTPGRGIPQREKECLA